MNHTYIINGIGFLDILLIVNIVLKLAGIINWSWWIVLWPFWLSIIIFIIILLIFIFFYTRF